MVAGKGQRLSSGKILMSFDANIVVAGWPESSLPMLE